MADDSKKEKEAPQGQTTQATAPSNQGQGGENPEGANKESFAQLVDRQEKAAEELKKQNDRAEELAAKNLMGGKSESGQNPQPQEKDPRSYAEEALKGRVPEENQ